MESTGSLIWFLAFLVQYGALVVAVVLVSALVARTVYELIRNKVRLSSRPGSARVDRPAEGTAA